MAPLITVLIRARHSVICRIRGGGGWRRGQHWVESRTTDAPRSGERRQCWASASGLLGLLLGSVQVLHGPRIDTRRSTREERESIGWGQQHARRVSPMGAVVGRARDAKRAGQAEKGQDVFGLVSLQGCRQQVGSNYPRWRSQVPEAARAADENPARHGRETRQKHYSRRGSVIPRGRLTASSGAGLPAVVFGGEAGLVGGGKCGATVADPQTARQAMQTWGSRPLAAKDWRAQKKRPTKPRSDGAVSTSVLDPVQLAKKEAGAAPANPMVGRDSSTCRRKRETSKGVEKNKKGGPCARPGARLKKRVGRMDALQRVCVFFKLQGIDRRGCASWAEAVSGSSMAARGKPGEQRAAPGQMITAGSCSGDAEYQFQCDGICDAWGRRRSLEIRDCGEADDPFPG